MRNHSNVCVQVFHHAPDQQAGHRVHGAGDVCVGAVSAALLGLLPRGRLLHQAARNRALRIDVTAIPSTPALEE